MRGSMHQKLLHHLNQVMFLLLYVLLCKYCLLQVQILSSLFLAHYSSLNYQSFTFYMLPFRAWEFLAGSILAYFKIFLKIDKSYNIKYPNFLSFLSFTTTNPVKPMNKVTKKAASPI